MSGAPGPDPAPAAEGALATAQAVVQAMTQFAPQARALGLAVDRVAQGRGWGRAWGRAPYRPDLVGDPETGVIAGGVITTFLDHVCGCAVACALEQIHALATIDLRIDYLRAAVPGRAILAEAHCYKVTRHVAFVRAVAYEETPDDPVANAVGAFMLNTQSPAAHAAGVLTGAP